MLSKNSVLSKIQRPGTVKYSPRKYDAIQTLATLGIYLVGFTKTQIQAARKNLAAQKSTPMHSLSVDNYRRLEEMPMHAMCPPVERTGSAEVSRVPGDQSRIEVAVQVDS